MAVLTSVLKNLKLVRSQEAVSLFEKTPPSEWVQKSQGLLGGASSSIELNEKMRSILMGWLIEVHLKFKLLPETLFLTINLIDRFTELRQVPRQNY
jgi:hypothetical protein